MKLTSQFKMKSSTKVILANILDSHKRGTFKRLMIKAQLAEEEARRQPLNRKEKE
jgi:hypothetical protein